jgi:hypothetical protein
MKQAFQKASSGKDKDPVQSMREAEDSIIILDPPAGTIVEKVTVEK